MIPDSNTIALVSVIVTGSAAVVTPSLVAWRDSTIEKRRFMNERTTSDLAELRAIFDETAMRLGDVISALDVTGPLGHEDRFLLLLEHRQELLRDLGRIAVRLGSDDGALLAAEDALNSLELLLPLLDPASQETGVTQSIVSAYERFDQAREEFYDAAQRRVGSTIEGPRREYPWDTEIGRLDRLKDALWRIRHRRRLNEHEPLEGDESDVDP